MKLGIHVNTSRHVRHVTGIAQAALRRGHEVAIFTMADGVKLLTTSEYAELCNLKGIEMSYCHYNAVGLGVKNEEIPPDAECGSQYNNAVMVSEADKVIVL